MNRNGLYMIIGALLVLVIGFGIYTYREETKPAGIEIQLNENGLKIDKN